MKKPDAQRSVESYRCLASSYDASCAGVMSTRSHAVALLGLRPGDVVVDVASGTGLSFPPIMDEIGAAGHLIAIEHSPEMMSLARQRVQAAGWRNVTLIEAAVEKAEIPRAFDAALFLFTHDVRFARNDARPQAGRKAALCRARPCARSISAALAAPADSTVEEIHRRLQLGQKDGCARQWGGVPHGESHSRIRERPATTELRLRRDGCSMMTGAIPAPRGTSHHLFTVQSCLTKGEAP